MSVQSPAASTSSESVRRRRPATACISCRDRRVKCDHARPACFQCTKRERDCQYPDPTPTTVQFVTEPLTQASGLRSNHHPSSQTWSSVIEQQVDLVKKANIKAMSPGTGVPFWTIAEAEEVRTICLELAGSWVDECVKPIKEDAMRSHPSAFPKTGIRISALGEWFISVLTPQLPPREICQRLFEHFLFSIHPVSPVCHVPTLRQEFAEFWISLSPDTSVDCLVHVLAILYTGAANSTSAADLAHSSSLYRLYEGVLRAVDFDAYRITSTSIRLLQGFVIMSTFCASQRSPFLAFGFLPRAIRFAQSLRLHVEQRTGNPIELEVRRRLWWHLMSLDVESTIASGLQGIVRPDGYTTGLPSVICDEAIVDDEAFPLLAGVSLPLSPMMVAMQGHWQWAQRMQIWFEGMPDQNEVIGFSRLIENFLGLISDCEGNEWPRTFLRMQIDRAYCMLGLRFWQLDQFKGTDCHSEVIRTSRSFLHKYLQLSKLSATQGLSWFVPGFIQPFHALIILLLHISGCSHVDEESCLSQVIVDQIFDLRINHILQRSEFPTRAMIAGGDKDETLQKSNPRYCMLWKLRERVWHKIGWPISSTEAVRGSLQMDMAMQGTAKENLHAAASATPPQYDDKMGDNTMTAALDDLLNSDPMDLLQWDEWESISTGSFVT